MWLPAQTQAVRCLLGVQSSGESSGSCKALGLLWGSCWVPVGCAFLQVGKKVCCDRRHYNPNICWEWRQLKYSVACNLKEHPKPYNLTLFFLWKQLKKILKFSYNIDLLFEDMWLTQIFSFLALSCVKNDVKALSRDLEIQIQGSDGNTMKFNFYLSIWRLSLL